MNGNLQKKNCQKICSPSSTSSLQETMDVMLQRIRREEKEKEEIAAKKRLKTLKRTDKEGKETAQRSWKIRLYPTKKERERLNQWIGIYRWSYNQCVAFYKQSGNLKKCPSKQTLRDKFVKKDALKENGKEWALDMLYNCRDKAMEDFVSAFEISKKMYGERLEKERTRLREKKGIRGKALDNEANNRIPFFDMKFKSKKQKLAESFYIRYKDWNAPTGRLSWLRNIKTKSRHPIEINYDTRVVKDSIGRFYLVVLKALEPLRQREQDAYQNVIALDPGVRTFLTGFDTKDNGFKFGKYGMNFMERELFRADNLNSEMNQKENGKLVHNHKRRQNMKKAMRRVFCKVKNQVKDAHHKISKFLCENYDAVLLPDFQSQQMVETKKRNIRGKTVRQLLTWSHYKFKQIIKAKAKRYDCLIVPCEEWYTSKTCSQCGNIDHNLGGNKIYKCKSCDSIMDRDLNAAKNILLKFLIEQSTERVEVHSSALPSLRQMKCLTPKEL
jgi:putative transposase